MESQLALLILLCQRLVCDNGRDALGGLHGSALFGRLGSSHCVVRFSARFRFQNHFFYFLFKAVMAESPFLGNEHYVTGLKNYAKSGHHATPAYYRLHLLSNVLHGLDFF